MGHVIRCLTDDATVMVMAIDSTDIVAEAERIHQPSAVVTAALGRMLTAASMMGIMLKGTEDSVTLKVSGDGPCGTITTVSDSYGNVRGYAAENIVEIPLRPDGKLDVGHAVGKQGMLYVMRDTGGKEPYVGCTPLVSGEIAEDVTSYYAQSEQTPTVCGLGVLVNPDLTVKAAGGFLLQLLPFCPEDVIDRVEANIEKLQPVTTMLDNGMSLEDIVSIVLDGFEYHVLDSYDPAYRCTCSREKVERALSSLSEEERLTLPDENGLVETTCNFCDSVYRFTKNDLEQM